MNKGTIIETDKFILRPWNINDAEGLALIANNKNVADNLRDGFPFPYHKTDAINWLNQILPLNIPTRFFAIEINKKIAGSIGIVDKDNIYRLNAEIGYFLGQEYWNKGIITKVILEIVKYIFDTCDVIRIYAEPFEDNTGSKKALENAGFHLEATLKNNIIKNGIIKSSCIYTLLKQ